MGLTKMVNEIRELSSLLFTKFLDVRWLSCLLSKAFVYKAFNTCSQFIESKNYSYYLVCRAVLLNFSIYFKNLNFTDIKFYATSQRAHFLKIK